MNRFATALAILVIAMAAGAQTATSDSTEPRKLSPDEAVELAVTNNLSLERSRVDVAAAKRALDRSWNGLLPGLSLSLGGNKPNQSTGFTYGSVGASITLSPSLLDDKTEASLSYDAENLSYSIAVRDLELSVRKAYYALILANENVLLTQQSILTAQKSYDQTEANRKVGLASELEVLTAQVSLENLKPDLESAKLSYANKLDEFKQLLGLGLEDSIALTGSLDEAAAIAEIDFSTLEGESPSVASLRASLKSAEAARTAAERILYSPSLSLSFEYQPTYSSTAWSDDGSISAVASFSLDKLLPWSEERENINTATDTVNKLENELAEAEQNARVTVNSLKRQIQQSLAALKARKLNVSLAERSYALTEEAYRFGTKDLLSLQSAADNLQEARVNVQEEAYTLISAVLDMEYALNIPFGSLGR